MAIEAKLCSARNVLPFRERYREEMNCQILHDAMHRRVGWTLTYLLELGGVSVGFGSVAVGGPWKDKPTVFEFYVAPEHRVRAFELFEALLATAGARFMQIQSNDALLAVMLHTYADDIASSKIVFQDKLATALPANGATLRPIHSKAETREAIEIRRGGPEWHVQLDGEYVGRGGLLFHYNRPYGDIWMEVIEPFRRRGFGSWFVQELKRAAYALDAVPCARCDSTNIASRRTLLKAGFVPCAHLLTGGIGK